MKKIKTRMLSVFLSVLMVVSSVHLDVFATEMTDESENQIEMTEEQEKQNDTEDYIDEDELAEYDVEEASSVEERTLEMIESSETEAFTDDVNALEDVKPTKIEFGDIGENGIILNQSEEYVPMVVFIPENTTNKQLSWESSDSNVASVDINGKITANHYGTTTISATTEEGNITASFVVNVFEFGFSSEVSDYTYGKEYPLTFFSVPENFVLPADIVWSSSDNEIASIDQNGKLSVHGLGSVTITATCLNSSAEMEIECLPDTPTWISTELDENNQITIKWDAVEEVDYYEVRKRVNDDENEIIVETDIPNSNPEISIIDDEYTRESELSVRYYIYVYQTYRGILYDNAVFSTEDTKVTPVYAITYHLGAGDNHPNNPHYVRKNEEFPLYDALDAKGYVYKGWFLDSSYKKQITSFENITSDLTLYAKYDPIHYYIVYHKNDGTDTKKKVPVAYNEEHIINSDAKLGWTRKNYALSGWNTEPNGYGAEAFGAGQSVCGLFCTEGRTIDLYAQWIEGAYTISFDTLDGNKISSKTVLRGEEYGDLPVPERYGYEFYDWLRVKNDPLSRVDCTMIFREKSNITLYAYWQPKTVNISLDLNDADASFNPDDNSSLQATYGGKYGELPVPKKPGYRFDGWYIHSDNGEKEKITRDSIISLEDHILFAHWEEAVYKVEFSLQGGKFEKMPTVFADAKYKEKVADVIARNLKNEGIEIPTKLKASFDNWYTSKYDNTLFDFDSEILGDVVIYAHWNQKYTAQKPVANIADGSEVEPGTHLVFTTNTKDAKIYYTTDAAIGTEVSPENGILFEDAIILQPSEDNSFATSYTFFVRAFSENYESSEPLIVHYTIKNMSAAWGDVQEEDRYEFSDATEVPDALWISGVPDSVPFKGQAYTFPDMRVYYGKILLEESKSYSVSYRNNTKAGNASVVITGKGDYAGSITKTFVIEPLALEEEDYFFAPGISMVFNNRVQKGTTTVSYKVNGKWEKLKSGTDFTYYYDMDSYDYKETGSYEVYIIGKGNYCGSAFFIEDIVEKTEKPLFHKLTFKAIPTQTATGEAIEPFEDIHVFDGKKEIFDYEVTFLNNLLPGTATAVLRGTDEYVGTKILTFKIAAINLNNTRIAVNISDEKIFNGLPQELTEGVDYTITYTPSGNKEPEPLTEGIDYEVSYINHINAGKNKAQICFTGINRYTGVIKKNFTIKPRELLDSEVNITPEEIGEINYQKGGVIPQISLSYRGWTLKSGVDYTLKVANNTTINDGTNSKKVPIVTITGKGNYTGTVSRKFYIGKNSLSNVSLAVSDVVYQNKSGICKPVVTLTDANGKKLSAGTDYEKTIEYTYVEDEIVTQIVNRRTVEVARNGETDEKVGDPVDLKKDIIPNGAKIRVTVTGKGSYTGTNSAVFRFVAADIAKASVTVEKQTFTGKPIKPMKKDIVVKFGKNEPLAMSDYEIVDYSNNVSKGSGILTIKGVGNYGGTKTVKFSILNKSMNYTIIYDNNDEYMKDCFDYSSPATGIMKNSVTATGKKVAKNTFRREGYVFESWNTTPDGSGVRIANGGVLNLIQSDFNIDTYGGIIRLYAQWTPAVYKITYPNATNGKNGVENYSPTYYMFGEEVYFDLPYRDGYTAEGFYLDSAYKKPIDVIPAGAQGNKTIYVKWIKDEYEDW